MGTTQRIFPVERFELLVRSYLDGIIDWDTMHNFAIAHIDDDYEPAFQRPIEDLHLMFLPSIRHDSESEHEKPQIRYLLDVLQMLRSEVEQFGVEPIRERELNRIASEDPTKHTYRAQHRERYRRKQ
jgi:hypothetical protein